MAGQRPGSNWIGYTLGGRYKIEALLGQGGMSAVYKAVDPNLRRTVAIKLIHPHLSSDPQFVRRFEQEAAAVAQLRHPNIIQVYDFNHDGDVYYMVLEYIPGETLQQRLSALSAAGQQLPLPDVVSIMSTVCRAVAYAHDKGMIHRDLKPANVMLTPTGQPILMDFGVAKMLSGTQHTATGAIIGTARYMSPEQARGDRPDHRTDIYSLGVMLFEMVAGQPPFDADSTVAVLMQHVTQPPPDIRQLRTDTPDALAAVIEKALEKQPENRFQSAAEMAEALSTSLSVPQVDEESTMLEPSTQVYESAPSPAATMLDTEPPPTAVPTPQPDRGTGGGNRTLWGIVGVGAVLVLAVLAGGGFLLSSLLGGDEATPTATATTVAQTAPDTPTPSPESAVVVQVATTTPTPPAPTATPTAEPSAEAATATALPASDTLPTSTPAPPPPSPTPEPSPPPPQSPPDMVLIPAGTFLMGSSTGAADEQPEHEVTLDAFLLDRFEVSNADYRRCVVEGGCTQTGFADGFTRPGYRDDPAFNNFPVVGVTWQQAAAYCRWAGKRLPTEAEWEYAASGPENRIWPWGNTFNPALTAASAPDTQPVDSHPDGVSPFGIFNMAGNVNEWVQDVYDETFYSRSPARNPVNLEGGDRRVFRGGSFANPDGSFYTTSRRYSQTSSFADVDIGFRCAANP